MNYLHSGAMGDVIFGLPTIRSIKRQQAERFSKCNIWLRPDVMESIPDWAGHRQPARMTREQAESLIPLLKTQEGIGEVALYTDQAVDIDLDRFRSLPFNRGTGDIGRYASYAYKAAPALYERWIRVEPSDRFKGMLLVNRTRRYHNKGINYQFLAGRPDVVFVGFPDEAREFAKEVPRLPHEQAADALELAQWIAGAKGFIGNQSFAYSLAEAMKTPRLLEVYPEAPNVIPHGPKGRDALSQELFQAHAEDLLQGD